MFSDNVDLQRSASLTFAEITERGTSNMGDWAIFGAKGLQEDGMACAGDTISKS